MGGAAHRDRRLSATAARTGPRELSGGQQQRVAVARALVRTPAVVFADEPTGNLDSKSSAEVLGLLRRAVDEFGQTVVMVTHDSDAAAIADRLIELADGRIVRDEAVVPGVLDLLSVPHRDDQVVFRGLGARKLRTALTALAVVLGVAMISGHLRPDGHDRQASSDVFQTASQGVDVVRHGASRRGSRQRPGPSPPIDESLLAKVQAVDGVASADGRSSTRSRSATRRATASAPAARRTSSPSTSSRPSTRSAT